MATKHTTRAIALRFALLNVAQGARTKVDGATIGFPAMPSANSQEAVLSPAGAGNTPPATVIECLVRSVIFIRTGGGAAKITVTKSDNSSYEQVVGAFFALSLERGAEPVTVEIETAETHNISAKIVWS